MILATLLQLIGLFRQEKRATTNLDHAKFYEWLVEHRFEELKNLISDTYHLSSEVDTLLRQDHVLILEKLDGANKMLADILAHIETFQGIALATLRDSALSNSAIDLLRLFDASNDESLAVTPWRGKFQLVESGRWLIARETRFLDDDLASLVSHGLLIPLHLVQTNTPGYRLTRRAEQFLQMTPKTRVPQSWLMAAGQGPHSPPV